MDVRIVNDGQNQGVITAANVRPLARANALLVAQVNASGDIVNPGGGGSSSGGDGAILDGANSAIKATVKQYLNANPLGVVLMNASGDVYNGNQSSVTVNKWNLTPTQDSVGINGGLVGVTGDVSTTPKAGQTWPISIPGVIGAQVVGGSIGVTGDVSTIPKAGQTWPVREQGVVGVQIVGGQSGGSTGVSGDVSVKPSQTSNIGNFPVSGDQAIVDGVTRSTKATVRSYANANPVAVSLTNASGDTYSPTPKEPICTTIPFNITTAGTRQLAGPYNGRVIKVVNYAIQGSSDIATAQGHFGSAASGSQLSQDWLLAVREGVTKDVSPVGGGYLFKTNLNEALVFELSAGAIRGSVTFQTGDSF